MDDRAIELYKTALEEGKEHNYNIRIMVTGPYGVGKSTFTKRLLYQDVDINDRASTDGIDVHVKKCKVSIETSQWNMNYRGDNSVQRLAKVLKSGVRANDTAEESLKKENQNEVSEDYDGGLFRDSGKEKSASNTVNYVYAESSPKSAAATDENIYSNTCHIVRVDDAQKSADHSLVKQEDLEQHEELLKELKEVISNPGDEDLADVSVWDFGGQFVFYTTHQMFLSRRAIYILIINMSQHIDDVVMDDEPYFDCSGPKSLRIEDFIDIWLNSIHGHSYGENQRNPPVILVGTHADKLHPETREDKTENIFDAIRNRFNGKDVSLHFIEEDFGLNNAIIDPKLEELRQTILEVAKQQPYWGELKPAKWIHLERVLGELRGEGVEILSHSEIEQLTQKLPVPIVDDEELELFLRFQHETGNLMYFSDPELKDRIVLSPQFLVNALKSLITAEMFFKKKAEIRDKLGELRCKGILRPSLIDAVWKREENRRFRENREHILALMEHLNIIAKPVLNIEDDEPRNKDNDYYLVPCMLKEPPLKPFLNAESQFISTPNLCLVLENAAFPSAIFNRLLVGCIARWPIAESGGKIQIYCGCGQFDVDNQQSHRLTLAFHDNVVSLRITKFSKTKHPDKSICNDVYTSVKQILDRISKCLSLTIKPKEYVQCPGDTTDVVSCKHSIERLKSCDEFPCHKHTTVTILHSCDLLKYWFEDSYHEPKEADEPMAMLCGDKWLADASHNTDRSAKSVGVELDEPEDVTQEEDNSDIADGPITQEHLNHTRMCNALVKVCADGLREILLSHLPQGCPDFHHLLVAKEIQLRGMRQLRQEQLDILYPDPQNQYTGNVYQFDITLLYLLIRNISAVVKPGTDWGKPPGDNPRDTSLGANVERIRCFRNDVVGHSVDNIIDEQTFEDTWKKICQTMDDIENVIGDKEYTTALREIKTQAFSLKQARLLQKKFKGDIMSVVKDQDQREMAIVKAIDQLKLTVVKGFDQDKKKLTTIVDDS